MIKDALLCALFFLVLLGFLTSIAGTQLPPEEHVVHSRGNESGVEIEVLLKNGGTALLVCPKFVGQPMGAHGRECYIRNYSTEKEVLN